MSDELRAWAHRVPIKEGSHGTGVAKVRLVLLALAEHVSADGVAFPGAQTLADEMADTTRRDVTNAFTVLEREGLITRDGKAGRSVRWRFQVSGYPATLTRRDTPTHARANVSGDVSGDVSGHVSGYLSGFPGANGSEDKGEGPPPPPSDPAEARCPKHVGVAEPPPCRGCQRARERAEAAHEQADARQRAVRERARRDRARRGLSCTRCDGTFVVDADRRPTSQRCDHPPEYQNRRSAS